MNVLDLFCGAAGGWSAGLEQAGYRTVAACEIDPWRRAIFAASHPGCVMYDDVRELTAGRLRADLGFLPDIVVGSPPCQEISAANTKGQGITDDHLFWEWARLVFEIRPVWCGAENSPRSRTEGIDGILAALDQANYAAWPCVVGAVHAGANHGRLRLWLLAADAERHELWQQPRRRGGTNRRSPAVAGDDVEHANQQAAESIRWRIAQSGLDHANFNGEAKGCSEFGGSRGGGCIDAGVSDTERVRDSTRRIVPAIIDPNTARERRLQRWTREAPTWDRRESSGHHTADSDGVRHAVGPRLGSDDGQELPAALRDIGLAWPHWNGGISGLSASCAAAGFGALDDGTTAILAPGLRNRAIAALGDAVIPQIPEAAGRAFMKTFALTPDGPPK